MMKSVGIFFRSDSIYECAKPIYFLSKLFGYSCFSFDFKTKKTCFTFTNILILFCSIGVWGLIASNSLDEKNFSEASKDSTFTKRNFIAKIYNVHSSLNPLIMLLTVVAHNFQRNHVSRFLEKISIFDETLKKALWSFQSSNSRAYILYIIAALISVNSIKLYFLMKYSMLGEMVLMHVGVALDVAYIIILLSQFLLAAFCVLSRMKLLGRNFKSLHISESRGIFLVRSKFSEKLILQTVTKLYKNLIDAIDEINSVFTIAVRKAEKISMELIYLQNCYPQVVPFFVTFMVMATTFFYTRIEANE